LLIIAVAEIKIGFYAVNAMFLLILHHINDEHSRYEESIQTHIDVDCRDDDAGGM
jgi:hypothetical protein